MLCDFDNTLCGLVRMLFGLTLLYVIHLIRYVALVLFNVSLSLSLSL